MSGLYVDITRSTLITILLCCTGVHRANHKDCWGRKHRFLAECGLVECRSGIDVACGCEAVVSGIVVENAVCSDQVDLEWVERARRGGGTIALFAGDALRCPQELPNFRFGKWLVAVFPYRAPVSQCLFEG